MAAPSWRPSRLGGRGMTGYGLNILAQHAKLLRESAISPDVARERGYVSADSKKQVERYGFPPWQCRTGLLIPMRRADGSVWGYQLRSDMPRVSKQTGKAFKYETPPASATASTCRPAAGTRSATLRCRCWSPRAPARPTAPSRRGSRALPCRRVWGWRGRNGKGGKLAVADWHDIALNGRRVVLAFDSDRDRKARGAGRARRVGRLPGHQGRDGGVPAPARRRAMARPDLTTT